MPTSTRFVRRPSMALLAAVSSILTTATWAQQPSKPALSLTQAIDAARRSSPDLRAAREAVAAATARERQATAYPNPTFSYGREQTSAAGESSSQNIAAVEQRLELGGARGVRADAARLRREAAAARLDAAAAQLDYETTRAYALALAADRRATLAEQATEAFAQARGISERRLAAGDVSGYAHRRIRLEAARYAGVRAEALLARRSARIALATLINGAADSIVVSDFALSDSLSSPNEVAANAASVDSLLRLALRTRADLRAADLDAATAATEARLTARERIPQPALSIGFKNERIAGAPEQANGFTAGLSIPLPLWDRRAGAIAAADADSRRRVADADALRRRIAREVIDAHDGYSVLATQLELLAPELGGETRTAMRAVQVAYSEGEATVVEWLDAVRAYQEAESIFATLRAEITIRRAALDRAVGVHLSSTTNRRGGDAPDNE